MVDGQYFGLDSMKVRSIETGRVEAPLGNTPDFCEGIIKFRDEWVPIIRLRTLLDINRSPEPMFSQIIYLMTSFGTLGLRVDQVAEIVDIGDQQLQSIPIIVNTGKTAYLAGACSVNGRILVVMNEEKIYHHMNILVN